MPAVLARAGSSCRIRMPAAEARHMGRRASGVGRRSQDGPIPWDNGKPDDTGIKDLISPFQGNRSALADGVKLATSGFQCRKSVLVYGFEDVDRPLQDALDALDVLLRQRVGVDGPHSAVLEGLRHPVFVSGQVAAWEMLVLAAHPS